MTAAERMTEIPPLPSATPDAGPRRQEARRRIRLLDGSWFLDLQQHMSEHFDPVRERIVGRPDISTNLFASITEQLAVLYDRKPILGHEDKDAVAFVDGLLTEAGWWSLGTRLQQYTIGLRECFQRPTWTSKGLLLRTVTPDAVDAEGSPECPDEPWLLTEARVRSIEGKPQWYWDRFDIRDPERPIYQILRAKDGEDVSPLVLGDAAGTYPFRGESGEPLIPYATYHAQRTNDLWSWRRLAEAVDGTLTVAVLWSWWVHLVRDTSWAQRWTINAALRGASTKGSGASTSASVTTDPSSVMQFMSDSDFPAAIGQWSPPTDPLTVGTALAEYESRMLMHFGLTPADVQRSESASSGYSISLRRDAVRAMQRRFIPQFERGDKQLLRIISCLGRMQPDGSPTVKIPEDGWSITYPGQPESAEEMEARLAKWERLTAAGLASRVDAYMAHYPNVDRDQALDALRRIADENRALS